MSQRIRSIEIALRNLGGQARTTEIAAEIRRLFPGPHPRTLLDSIRGRLQERSSDSKLFRGGEDLFYRVNGIGGGVWGLRQPASSAENAGYGIYGPDLDQIIDRLERGAQPLYGSVADNRRRQKLAAATSRLKGELDRLQPAHGGIGHNQPPADAREEAGDPDVLAAVASEATTIETEVQKEEPDALTVARSARKLQRIASWLSGKADIFAEEFARSLGKSLGKFGGAAIAAGSLAFFLENVARSAAQWLQLVVP